MRKLSKNEWIGVVVAIVVTLILLAFGNFFYQVIPTRNNNITMVNENTENKPATVVTKEGLEITDTVIGVGAEAKNGSVVTVNYVGTLTNGTKFDSSIDRGVPFQFNLGVGQVIRGWDLGVLGMKVGGKRHLVIPAALAYGDNQIGDIIPAGSTLVFDVELLEVK